MSNPKSASATAGAIAPSRPVEPGRGPLGNPIAMGAGGTPINTGAGTGIMGSRLASGGTSTNMAPGQEAAPVIDPKDLEKAQQDAEQAKAQLQQLKAQTSMQKLESQHASRMGSLSSGFAKGHALKSISGMQSRLTKLHQRALGARFKFAAGIPGAPEPMTPDLQELASPGSTPPPTGVLGSTMNAKSSWPKHDDNISIKKLTPQEFAQKNNAPYVPWSPRTTTRSGAPWPADKPQVAPSYMQVNDWTGTKAQFDQQRSLERSRGEQGLDPSTGHADWRTDLATKQRAMLLDGDWSGIKVMEGPGQTSGAPGSWNWIKNKTHGAVAGTVNSIAEGMGAPAGHAVGRLSRAFTHGISNEFNHARKFDPNAPLTEMLAPDGFFSNLGQAALPAAHTVMNVSGRPMAAASSLMAAGGNYLNDKADTEAFVQQEQASQEQRVAARQQFQEGPPPDTGIMEWLAQLWSSIAPYLQGQAGQQEASQPLPTRVGAGGHAVTNYKIPYGRA